jgi:ATP-dependent DNA ligase
VRSAVLDVEIVCLNEDGKPEFRDLLFRRGEPRFVTFDLLWSEGKDLRYSPLTERKHKVQTILSTGSDRILIIAITSSTLAWACSSLACDNDPRADIVYGIITLKAP